MQRVAFLIEETGETLGCLLNPENLVLRRVAGVQPRRSVSGQLSGAGMSDGPLLYTGGGRTQLDLDLLFDVSLTGSSVRTNDVRDLTGPLWDLAENAAQPGSYGQMVLVRLIWGKSWNVPGVVTAVSERLEHFTSEGVPRRSWLRLRMQRVSEPRAQSLVAKQAQAAVPLAGKGLVVPEGAVRVHELHGGEPELPVHGSTPAVEADLSITGAIVTGADIIAAALAETPAGRMLASARDSMAGAVDSMTSAIRTWWEESGDSQALQAVRDAVDRISSAMRRVATEARIRLVQTVTAASATVSAAVAEIRFALGRATDAAVEAVRASLAPVLDTITPVARSMAQAAGLVARAAKAGASRVIAQAAAQLVSARVAIRSALESVADRLTALGGSKAGELVDAAVDTIGTVVGKIRSAGETAAAALMPAAMEKLGTAAEMLWAVGETAAAKVIGEMLPVLASAVKGVLSGAEAISSAMTRRTTSTVRASVEAGQGILDEMRATGDMAQMAMVRRSLAEIDAGAGAIQPAMDREAVAPIAEALQAIQPDLEEIEAATEPAAASAAIDRVSELLETIASTARDIDEAEEIAAARMVGAVATGEQEAEGEQEPAPRDRAGQARLGWGERLDQLSFRYYGDPALWRALATYNDIDHPLRVQTGQLLRIPPAPVLAGA